MTQFVFVPLISLMGGMVQTVTGFGAGIIIMLFLHNVLPMNIAPAVSNTTCAPLAWSIAWKYHKAVSVKKF